MSPVARTARTILTLSILVLSSTTHARDYLIEVVIFETNAGRNLATDGLLYPRIGRDSLRLGTDDAANQGFLPIDEGLTLNDNAAAIAESGRYRLIRHMAWRQPGLDTESAIPVRISAGEGSTMFLPDDLSEYEDFIPATPFLEENMSREITAPSVSGTINIRLGRFLHMETNLVFTDAETNQSFKLTQNRKMRSSELHYIDNPRFGLLTRISRLEDKISTASDVSDVPNDILDDTNSGNNSAGVTAGASTGAGGSSLPSAR